MSRGSRAYLYDAVKRGDLKAFIERESGVKFEGKGGDNWVSICPFHREAKPSFSVTKNSDGIWVYNCFGCQSHGTVIDYCKERFDLVSNEDALLMAAEKEGIKCDESMIIKASRDAKVQTDKKHEIDMAHYATSGICRRLLRMAEGNEAVTAWVMEAYKELNRLMDDEKTTTSDIARVGNGAMRMIAELQEGG
jgi:DNA primase